MNHYLVILCTVDEHYSYLQVKAENRKEVVNLAWTWLQAALGESATISEYEDYDYVEWIWSRPNKKELTERPERRA